MIRLSNFIESNSREELEALQTLLESFSSSFNYSIVENFDNLELPFRLLVQIETGIVVKESDMQEFLSFVSAKIAELNG